RHARGLVTAAGVVAAIVRGEDGHLRGAIFRGSRLVRLLPGIGIADVAITKDGTRVATAGQNGLTEVWDTRTGRSVREFVDAKSGVHAVSFSPDGSMLASGGEDSGGRIWDIVHGEGTYLLFGHTNPVEHVVW